MDDLGNTSPDNLHPADDIETTRLPGYRQVANILVAQWHSSGWKILFIHRKEGEFTGQLSIPGGEVESEQDGIVDPYRAAASRELREETTLDRTAEYLRPVGIGISHDHQFESHLFALELPPDALVLVYSREPENHDVRWLTPDQARAFPLAPGVPEMLERVVFDRARATLDIGAFATQQVIEFGGEMS